MDEKAYREQLERQVQADLANGYSMDDLTGVLRDGGVVFSTAGGFKIERTPGGGSVTLGSSTPTSPTTTTAPTQPPAQTSAPLPTASSPAGGSTALPTSSGPAGRQSSGASWGGGGGGGGTTTIVPGGGAGGGVTQINPNAPLGLKPSAGGAAGYTPGTQGAAGVFGNPGSVLTGLNEKSTLNDVIMNIVKRQEANRDAALATYGGALKTAENDPVMQGSRARAMDVLNNPFSLDDATVSRILGAQTDLIGQNFARLGQQSADRAAAAGMGRSGDAQLDQDRLAINAVKGVGDAQRGLLVEQATRRPAELQASLASAGEFGMRDVGQRTGIATQAADHVYGQTSILGDAMLTGALMGGQAPTIKVNDPYQGYLLGPNTTTR